MPKVTPYVTRASYMYRAFDEPKTVIREARNALHGVKFDTIIGTGLSGAVIVPMMAHAMRKYFAIVRKPKEQRACHAHSVIEGKIGARWLFVDDMIDSGTTFGRVREAVGSWVRDNVREGFKPRLVGSYTYQAMQYRQWGNPTDTPAQPPKPAQIDRNMFNVAVDIQTSQMLSETLGIGGKIEIILREAMNFMNFEKDIEL